MSSKKSVYHLLIRIGILTLLIGTVFVIWCLTFDPHKYCDNNIHRHVDGGLGMVVMTFMTVSIYYFILFIEMLYLFVKKRKDLAFINLGFLIISSFLVFVFMYRSF